MKPKITSKIRSISSSKETHPHKRKQSSKIPKPKFTSTQKALRKKRENSKIVFHKKNQENIFPKNT
jgi:hypothetical protein